MSITLVESVNRLFDNLYPYIARQVAEAYGRRDGLALEIGPYGPGISMELARLCPGLRFVVGDDNPEINEHLRRRIKEAGLEERLEVREVDKYHLPFPDSAFDLVVFRGAFFFWGNEAAILKEIFRVLKAGGVAVAGGGFGAEAPQELIDAISDKSRELNRQLGKRHLSESEVANLLAEAGVAQYAEMERRHGLWVIVRKD